MAQNKDKKLFEKFKTDPVFYVDKALGHRTWSKQIEFLESVRDNQRTAVMACHGSSKTFTAAELAIWWFKTHYPAVVVITAPKEAQIRDYMFKEMKSFYSKAKVDMGNDELDTLRIKWIKSDGKENSDAFIVGTTSSEPSHFEGFHSTKILLIIDEAKGVANNMYASFEGLLTSKNSKMILISTGGSDSTMYSKCFTTNRSFYNCITINAFSTPFFPKNIKRKNYKTHDQYAIAVYNQWEADCNNPDYDRKNYEWELKYMDKTGMVTPAYEKSLREMWGSESVEYRQKVFAENCAISEQQLLSTRELEAVWAKNPDNLPDKESIDYPNPKAGNDNIGSDVGFENDRSCVVRKQGNTFTDIDIIEGSDSVKLSFFITEKYQGRKIKPQIDSNGIGRGTYDVLKNMGHQPVGILYQEKPTNNAKFVNLRAELFWEFREAIRNKELWFLVDKSKMDLVIEEFTSIRFFTNLKGQIQIASKKDIKKILGRSPDIADAIILSTAKQTVDYEALKKRKKELEANMKFGDLGRN